MARMRRYPIWMNREIVSRNNTIKKYKHLLKETETLLHDKEIRYLLKIKGLKDLNDSLTDYLNKNVDITALINFEYNKNVPKEFILKEVKKAFLTNLSEYLIVDEVGFMNGDVRTIKINPYDDSVRRDYYVKIDTNAYHKAANDKSCHELHN